MNTELWYKESGNMDDVAVSSRVRLARNISGVPFMTRLSETGALSVVNEVRDAINIMKNRYSHYHFDFLNLKDLNKLQRLYLLERHIISPTFVESPLPTALAVSKDESLSIMVNEEDHIRIQAFSSGLNLKKIYEVADKIDDFLNENLDFSFSEEFGYLTMCPTNLGSGMRASLMLHLPALRIHGVIDKLKDSISKIGFTIRGIYGEGTSFLGDMYQVSYQITLGITEESIIKNLENIAVQLINQEKKLRNDLKSNLNILDEIHRAFGILSSCRLLSAKDLLDLSSKVRLGIALGEFSDVTFETINLLMFNATNANISFEYAESLTDMELGKLRADFARKTLAGK